MKRSDDLDKLFLLTYTYVGYDGFRHSGHAWFSAEKEMQDFVKRNENTEAEMEIDLAIEILEYRKAEL